MTNAPLHYFQTIETPSQAEFTDRGSRFIAMTYPVSSIDAFKSVLNEVKKNHPKASHYCFAYRMGPEGDTFRASDAGEPSGTAGRPILGQIDSKGLTNVVVIVVRYFGGTLLGVPGLIHAYKTSASLALQLTPMVRKPVEISYEVQFDYTVVNDVEAAIRKFNCSIRHKEMQLFCLYQVGVPSVYERELLAQLNEIRGVVCRSL